MFAVLKKQRSQQKQRGAFSLFHLFMSPSSYFHVCIHICVSFQRDHDGEMGIMKHKMKIKRLKICAELCEKLGSCCTGFCSAIYYSSAYFSLFQYMFCSFQLVLVHVLLILACVWLISACVLIVSIFWSMQSSPLPFSRKWKSLQFCSMF